MNTTMLSGIIVTHAGLAEAMRAAAAHIAGDVRDFEVVSNDGCSSDSLRDLVRAALERTAGRDTIVFTDMGGGSCATTCQELLRDYPHARLVTGVNLPMLVDFVLRRGDLSLDAMVTRLLQRGQSSIQELE